jgi:hypothetical protein
MVNSSRFPTLTVNWISERKQEPRGDSYFRQLVFSCVEGLRDGETVFVFTQDQVNAVVRRANFNIVVKELDGCFSMKKVVA